MRVRVVPLVILAALLYGSVSLVRQLQHVEETDVVRRTILAHKHDTYPPSDHELMNHSPEREEGREHTVAAGEGKGAGLPVVLDIRECIQLINVTVQQRVSECVYAFNRGPGGNINYDRLPVGAAPAGSPVVVIPVHDRADHLVEVIRSWQQGRSNDAEMTIIVSHDGFFEDVHQAVRGFESVRIKQIYHPHAAFFAPSALWATHLHRYTRLKHHFWWLLQYVWRHPFRPNILSPTRDVFINEDDLMTATDAYAAAQALFRLLREHNDKVNGTTDSDELLWCVSLARHKSARAAGRPYLGAFDRADLFRVGLSSFQALGWGLTGTTADLLLTSTAAQEQFCTLNEYNWDRTIAHMMAGAVLPSQCLNLFWPRSGFHIGSCGTHVRTGKNPRECEPAWVAADRMRRTVLDPLAQIVHEAASTGRNWTTAITRPRGPSPDSSPDRMLDKSNKTTALNEGWTQGRIWNADLPADHPDKHNTAPMFWYSTVHRDHCLAVATEDMS